MDGIILNPVDITNIDIIETMRERNLPVLQIFRAPFNRLDYLIMDDEKGTYNAADYIIKKGHKRILMVTETPRLPSYREKGFMRAFQENNLPFDREMIISIPLHAAFEKELDECVKKTAPTAILAIADSVGKGVYRYLSGKGFSIPSDMSLMVYDDLPWMSLLDITAISHPVEKIGHRAGQMILNRIKSQTYAQVCKIKMNTELLERKSVLDINEK